MIDLSPMKSVRVDPANRKARAEGGTRWGDFDRETQAFGLATTGGTNSDTGIAGLTLGGGIGWLSGKYGLSCDNLLSADVVTASGELLTASPGGIRICTGVCAAEAGISVSSRPSSTNFMTSAPYSEVWSFIRLLGQRKC